MDLAVRLLQQEKPGAVDAKATPFDTLRARFIESDGHDFATAPDVGDEQEERQQGDEERQVDGRQLGVDVVG